MNDKKLLFACLLVLELTDTPFAERRHKSRAPCCVGGKDAADRRDVAFLH
jgi:hypothetical protein